MRRFLLFLLLPMTLSIVLSKAAAAPEADEQTLLALVKEVQVQQAEIAANQTKIDAKLVEVAEAVRLARIFAGRER